MAAPVFEKKFVQDIRQPVRVRRCGDLMFTGDAKADTIYVEVYNDGAPYNLTGTVTLNCIRVDGATVAVTGSISGNVAQATLAQACCAISGPLAVVMKITSGDVTSTILKAVYTVDVGVTGTTVDPGTIVNNVNTLIAAIETAVESIPADYSDLLAATAPNYSDLTFPIKAGQHCWYDGDYYRAKVNIETSESWTAAHWESAVLSEDVDEGFDELKSAIGNTPMGTTATTVTGAIAEHESDIGDINTELDGKQDALTFDDSPTSGSNNPVKSGGVYSAIQDEANRAIAAEALKVNKPTTYPNGINGQLLSTNGDGTTAWVNLGTPTAEQVAAAVDDWLDDHPEATTTVDFSIVTKVFDTVSAMAGDMTLEAGDNVCTKGYYVSGDDGAANYVVSATHSGMFYVTLQNGLYANLLKEDKLISADVIGAVKHATKAAAEGDTDGAVANHTLIQAALAAGFSILFGRGYYPFSDYLEMYPRCDILGIKREQTFLVFPNSAGLKFLSYNIFNYQQIKRFSLYSVGDCISVAATVSSVINCQFDYLSLYSAEGECIVAPIHNRGARLDGDTCVWSCFFGHINGSSEDGAIFANICGLGNWFYFINVIGNTHIAFRNCSGTVQRLDTLTANPNYCFYYDDVEDYGLTLLLIDVHFEGCNKSFIYTEDETASTMGLGVVAIDSGVSNLDPYVLEPLTTPFIKVGYLNYLYHYGKYTMYPDETYYNMSAIGNAIIHVKDWNTARISRFKTNIGGRDGLKVLVTNTNTLQYYYGDYTYKSTGSGPYKVLPEYGNLIIDTMDGSRKHVTFKINDSNLPANPLGIKITDLDSDSGYVDNVLFEIKNSNTNKNVKRLELSDTLPGKVISISNSASATCTITLKAPAAGDTTKYCMILGTEDVVLNPGDSRVFYLGYDQGYLRWYPAATNKKVIPVSGVTPSITGVADTRYMCGTVESVNITPPSNGTIEVFFTSGSTAATLTMPRSVNVTSGFDPSALAANTKYKIKITDGVYGEITAFNEQPYVNLLDPTTFTDDKVWWNGSMTGGYTNFCATPKVAVTPGAAYILKRGGAQDYVSWFDENNTFISQEVWANNAIKTIATGVHYVGISILKTEKETALLAEY